jgi:zinc protease
MGPRSSRGARKKRGLALERVGGPADASPAPFVRARLPNGLRVLVRPNHALPIVAVDCWLAVGALDEVDEFAGVSHFLEHMFFKGTRRFPAGTMDRKVKNMGGYNNAATSMEYTHYYIVAPREHFATALALLADHLMDPALPADELDRERQVIVEEIRRKDDTPSGRLYTLLQEAVFGTSPYAREILGKPESLARIDREIMAEYWRTHYTAGRLVVSIAGDIDPEDAAASVATRFADLPSSGAPPPPPPAPEIVPGERTEAMDVGQAYVAWAFSTAGRSDLDELCALEIAGTILGEGMTSRLYRRLVEELRIVTSIDSWTYGLGPVGLLGIDAICAAERRAAVEEEIAQVIDALLRHGVGIEEVQRAQSMLAADFAYDNETNASLTGTLGEFEILYGAAEAYRMVLEGIARVTPEKTMAAMARRLEPGRAVRVTVGPDGA